MNNAKEPNVASDSVKRYEPTIKNVRTAYETVRDAVMRETKAGEYVEYDDYEALRLASSAAVDEVGRLQAELAQWHACNDAEIAANAKACELLAQVKPEVERLRAERDEARQALDDLYAVQNGAPLYKYEADWNAAMNRAAAILEPLWKAQITADNTPTTGGQGEGGKHEND